jgi:hypothetical protein
MDMACFLVPVGEAVVTTVIQKVVEKREKKAGVEKAEITRIKWSRRLSWLNKMLWGGSVLLVVDHIWNGEVIFRPPFFTALGTTGGLSIMLREMATLGVAMSAAITAVWGIMVLVDELKARSKVASARQVRG